MRKLTFVLAICFVLFSSMSFVGCNSESVSNLIVYTNQVSSGREYRLRSLIKSAGFDFDITFVELAGQNLKNRVISEKANPIADVVLGGAIVDHMVLKNENAIAPFTPTWLDKVDEHYHDPDGYYSTWAIEPLYIVYNKDYYSNDPAEVAQTSKRLAPTSYEDLANNFANQYNLLSTTTATSEIVYASILSKYIDPNGTHNISNEGWNLMKKLFAGGKVDGQWQQNLAGTQRTIAISWAGAILDVENVYNIELGIVRPDDGVPVTITQVSITNSGKPARMEASKKFVEWWGQTETQIAWSQITGQMPTNVDAYDSVDEKVREINSAVEQPLDWEFIAQNVSSWNQYIELSIK